MKLIIIFSILMCCLDVSASGNCPNEQAFLENGWIVHSGKQFERILNEKLTEFMPQVGKDLIVDCEASYISDFSHDEHMIMWVVVFDRVSTDRDEMWGDVAFSKTGPCANDYTEVRWYDPVTKERNIVCNPEFVCCLTTKVPLAYNTIF